MSGRTVHRFALAGLLAASLAVPAGAQAPAAPMPRPGGGIEIELDLSFGDILSRVRGTAPPCCAFDCRDGGAAATAPMPREKLNLPGFGPLVLAIDIDLPLSRGTFDHKQLVTISPGVFGGGDQPTPAPAPCETGCRTAMNGTTLAAGETWRVADFHTGPTRPLACGFDAPKNDIQVRVNETRTGTFMFKGSVNTDEVCDRNGGCTRVVLPPSPAIERCTGVFLWPPVPPAPAYRLQHDCCISWLVPVDPPPPPTHLWQVFPYPLANVAGVVRDESGTWWVEVQRVPQPKHAAAERRPTGCAPAPQWQGTAAGPGCGATLGAAVGAAIDRPAPAPDKAGKLAGTWVRDLDGVVIAATFAGDEMKLCVTQKAEVGDGEVVTVTFTATADYAVTREGLVHGVVTGVDLDTKSGSKEGGAAAVLALEMADGAAAFQQMVDSPFAFRARHTSAGVMVSGIKFAGAPGVGGTEFALLGGLYKPCKDGAIPTPRTMKPQTWTGGLTLPSGRYLDQSHPQYFSPDPQHPLPRELSSTEGPPALPPPAPVSSQPACVPMPTGGATSVPPTYCPAPSPGGPVPAPQAVTGCLTPPAPTFCPAPPANVPVGEFGMMAEVFGQMLGANKPQPAPQLLPPPQYVPYPGVVQPVGGPWPPPPSVAVAPPVTLPPPPTMPAPKPPLVGTWVREVGPVVYVVKIAPDHLTITATAAAETEDGKVATEGMILTADYHLTRDGTTAVGLVTSVDAVIDDPRFGDGELPRFGEELVRLQKALTDKPFALGVRVYGDVLAIGNVRLPEADGRGALVPLDMLGGRYTAAGNKPLPKPKAARVSGARVDLPPPPPARVSETPPAYDLPFRGPDADRLPPTDVPLTPAPAAPKPEEPKSGKKGKKKASQGFLLNVDSSDPNVRMQQLLYQSERTDDLRQIHNEWRRFWFNDQPSHLAPERIHGGIR